MPAVDGAAPVRRWLIVGSAGAGKSTLSRRMGRLLSLPVVHLDLHYWHLGWVPTPKDQWRETVVELSQGDEWVMDGNYSGTVADRLPYADAVVLLDMNPIVCLWRVAKRRFTTADRVDIPEGCRDSFSVSDLEFFWWIVSYRWRSRPRVLSRIADHPHVQLTTLRTGREVERFVALLAPESVTDPS